MLHHVLVGVQFDQFRALDAKVLRADEHGRVGAVEQRHLDFAVAGHVDRIDFVARGEELARSRAGRVEELHVDRGAGAGHALDGRVAVDFGLSVFHFDVLLDDLFRVRVVHAHHSHGLDSLDEAFVDRERPHGRGDVAAVDAAVHVGDGDVHLAERVVHVDAGTLGRCDDGDLARGRDGAAHAVDLLHVGRAHDLQKDLRPLALVRGKVLLVEDDGLARAAAHVHAGEFSHFHIRFRLSLSSRPGRGVFCDASDHTGAASFCKIVSFYRVDSKRE